MQNESDDLKSSIFFGKNKYQSCFKCLNYAQILCHNVQLNLLRANLAKICPFLSFAHKSCGDVYNSISCAQILHRCVQFYQLRTNFAPICTILSVVDWHDNKLTNIKNIYIAWVHLQEKENKSGYLKHMTMPQYFVNYLKCD